MSFDPVAFIGKKFKTKNGAVVKFWETSGADYIFKASDGARMRYDEKGVLLHPDLGEGFDLADGKPL